MTNPLERPSPKPFNFSLPSRPSYVVRIDDDHTVRLVVDDYEDGAIWFYPEDAERIGQAIVQAAHQAKRATS